MSRIEAGTIFFMDAVLSKFDRRKSFQAICDPPGRKKKISIPNMVRRRSSSFSRAYVSSPCGRQGQSRHLVEGGRNTPRGPFFFLLVHPEAELRRPPPERNQWQRDRRDPKAAERWRPGFGKEP